MFGVHPSPSLPAFARALGLLLVALALSACGTTTVVNPETGAKERVFDQPPLTYTDSTVPLSETAVITHHMKVDENSGVQLFMATIVSVDRKKLSCLIRACPFWVRVLPGSRQLKVTVQFMRYGVLLTSELDVEISAQAGKVYLLDSAFVDVPDGLGSYTEKVAVTVTERDPPFEMSVQNPVWGEFVARPDFN